MNDLIEQIADRYENIVRETGLIPSRSFFVETLEGLFLSAREEGAKEKAAEIGKVGVEAIEKNKIGNGYFDRVGKYANDSWNAAKDEDIAIITQITQGK
jgi:hypothetical protein